MCKFSRAIHRVPITQSDATVFDPPLVAIEIFTTGDLSFVEAYSGVTITKTFPTAANGGCYPYIFQALIRKVLDTNTTLADGAMLGFRE